MQVNQQRLVENFCKLVQIDSISSEEEELAEYLIKFLKDKVDHISKDSYGNVFASIKGRGEPIFLSAHMDTVEPGRGIKPIIKDGYIQSDKSTILGVDNKAALSCILEIIQIIKEDDLPYHPIELIFTCSEEKDALGGMNFDYSQLLAKKGYCFDYCAPLGGIIISSPLNEKCDIKLIGKAAHSTQPENGINILDPLKEFLNLVKPKKEDHILFNIGQIEVGQVRNSIPAEAEIKSEIRSFSEKALRKEKEFLEKVLEKLTRSFNIKYELRFDREYPGYTHESKEAKSFIEETKAVMDRLGIETELIKNWAISDANTFNNKELLCLNLSDGAENPHSTEERIKISELIKLAELILTLAI